MNENKEEQQMNLSDLESRFLNMIMTDPVHVFKSLSLDDILKPFIFKESTMTGGKLGIRSIAKKYDITERKTRTLIKHVKNNSEKWSE